MRFDHLVHWVPELSDGVSAYRSNGFHVSPGGEHPGWGTHNALSHFGLAYIEIVAVHDPIQMETPPAIFAEGAVHVGRGGGAGNFAIAVPNLLALQKRLHQQEIAMTPISVGQRLRPDGTLLTWQTATLQDGPPWRPFFIQWGVPDEERLADLQRRGIDQRHPGGYQQPAALVIVTQNPKQAAELLAAILDVKPIQTDRGWTVPLPLCDLLLEQGEKEQIEALTLRGDATTQSNCFGLDMETVVIPSR